MAYTPILSLIQVLPYSPPASLRVFSMRSQLLTQLLPLLSPSSPLKRRTSYSSSPCPFFTETTVQAFETYITADTKTPSYVVFLLPQLNGADGPTFLCNRSLTSMPHEPVTTVQLSQSIPCTEVPQTLGAPSSGVEVEFMYVGDRLTLTETVPCRKWVSLFELIDRAWSGKTG